MLIFFTCVANGQSRFFIFTEGWTSIATLEHENHYTVIESGTSGYPDFEHSIISTQLDKFGDILNSSQYQMDSTMNTEIRNQQSLSIYNEEVVMGITVRTNENLLKAKRLRFNSDLNIVTDSSWQYTSPQGDESIMFATHREQANTIVHGLNYHDGNTVNSTLLATDTLGNLIWESNFACGGNSCWMTPRHIHAAHDGGYIMTHIEERNSNNGPSIDDHDVVNIIKTDSFGAEQWRIHPGSLGEPYTSEHIVLQPTDDGNYLCAWADNKIKTSNVGHYNFNPDATIWLAKIAPDGSKIWEKNIQEAIETWGVDDTYYSMEQMVKVVDGNFVFISDDRLFKINQNAEVLWARKLNPLGFESSLEQEFYLSCYGLNQTSDGGYVCTGQLLAFAGTVYPEYLQTGFVLKLDEYGCLEEGCHLDDPVVSVEEVVEETTQLSIYPNPTNHDITISYQLPYLSDQFTLSIHNITGKSVHTQPLPTYEGSVHIELDKNLPAGTYFCHLKGDRQVLSVGRFVLIR